MLTFFMIAAVSFILGLGLGYLIIRILGTEDNHIDAWHKLDKGEY